MRALTTSEINAILIAKGYKSGTIIYNIPVNKWDANTVAFEEYDVGYSRCALYKHCEPTSGWLVCKANYKELKADEKKEFQAFIEALPNR